MKTTPIVLFVTQLIFALFTNSQLLATSTISADEDTSRSLLLNAAQYDTAPIKGHFKQERYIEVDSTFTFLPKRRDDVMGKGAENGPKRIILPELSINQSFSLEGFDVGVSAWGGYVKLDKVPLGKLKNYTVLHWVSGLSTQIEHGSSEFRYFYPISYQYTEGGITGGFIEEGLESESKFSCHQFGVGFGAFHTPSNIEGSLQVYRREMAASMQFDTEGALIEAQKLEAYRYSAQAALGYSFSDEWALNYAQMYIPGKLLVPRLGLSWHKAI